jgi:hypothetical protein
MDDDSFKTELLSRLDRIQALLSYLCGAAKAAEERAQAGVAAHKTREVAELSDKQPIPERNLIQEEMQDDYEQAVQRWKAGKV